VDTRTDMGIGMRRIFIQRVGSEETTTCTLPASLTSLTMLIWQVEDAMRLIWQEMAIM